MILKSPRPQVTADAASETQHWFELLQRLALRASQASEFEPVLHDTVRLICEYTGWPVGHVYVASDDVLVPTDLWYLSDEVRFADFRAATAGMTFEPGRGLPGITAQRMAPVWIESVADHPNFPRKDTAGKAGLGAAFAFPIIRQGRAVAVLEFFATDKAAPDATVLSFAQFASTLLSALLERLESEQQRRASEQVMRQVVETAPEAFIAISADGRIREWNPAAERIFGFSPAEVIGRQLADTIIPPAYREAHMRGVARLHETGEAHVLDQRLELPGLRKDGSEIPLELTISRLQTAQGTLFHAFLRDISDRKRAETALIERQRRLDDVQQLAHIGTWEWDIAANSVTWSDELYRIYGLTPETHAATFEGYLARVHPDDRARVQQVLGQALEQRGAFDFEERIIRPAGDVRILQSRGIVVANEQGQPIKLMGSCHDVTDIRRTARAAEAAGGRLQAILDSVADGICGVDRQGVITFINEAGARMLGWQPAELIGQPHHVTFHAADAADGGRCMIDETLASGQMREAADAAFVQKDGKRLPVAYTATPVVQDGAVAGVVVTYRDLSEQRRTEDEARRALMELVQEQAARAEAESTRGQLHRLFDQAPALVGLTYGPDHVFELANPKFMELIGERSVLGRPAGEALSEMREQGFIELLDAVYRSGEAYEGNEVPVRLEHEPDRERYFNFVYQPLLGAERRAYGILIHAVEVTEQVLARHQVEEKAAELAALATKLERTNRELDQFAYIASHDLKAPLRGVSNIASWLEEDLTDRLTDETRDYVDLMKKRVARMEDLINALLAYSRAGRVRGEPTSVNVAQVVREVADVLSDVREDVRVTIEGELPTLNADPLGLQQIFQNLMSNAVKYARAEVRVGSRDAGDAFEFYVADDGPGVDPRFHERIWGMFQRLHAPGEGEGTGIGLAIVRKIAEANHATTWLESEEGAGATFWVRWPKHQDGDN